MPSIYRPVAAFLFSRFSMMKLKKRVPAITDTHVSSLPFEIIVEKSRGINSSKICDNKGINITNAGNAISKNKDSCNDFARLGVVSYDSETENSSKKKKEVNTMTKMNEKTKGKWKARILAGALALSIAFPAGIMSQARIAKAASVTEEQTVSELSKLANVGIDTASCSPHLSA